jgi:ubiquinone/menaquinone biosynthesis C-methylase UbiE
MSTAEFDRIAEFYDETRRALDGQTLDGLKAALSTHGCRSVLEIGVGTGRVSAPLSREGFTMTGVDISRNMMERARSKGPLGLVLGDGRRTPFRDRGFDATILAHIIHLVEDPPAIVREGGRVSSVGVFALLRKRDERRSWLPFHGAMQGTGDPRLEEARKRFREIGERYGWTWDRSRLRNWGRERDLIAAIPPDELRVVSDVLLTETVEDRIARLQKGGYGFMREMPPEMKMEVFAEMRRTADLIPEGPRHEVHQLAFWRSDRFSGASAV